MTRYYFDLQDHEGVKRDDQGQEYKSLDQAIVEARKTLHQIAEDEDLRHQSALCIQIRDDERSLVTVITSTSVLPDPPNAGQRQS